MPRKTRDAALVVLVLVNVVLLCAALAFVMQLPRAHAQAATPAGQRFLAVSAMAEGGGTDSLFVLDPAQQRLYVFAPARTGSAVTWQMAAWRDLKADFSRQPTPVVPPRR